MRLLISIINNVAFVIMTLGLMSILASNFKGRDIAFSIHTSLLTIGAFLSWLLVKDLEIFAFVLLFALQIVANLLQIYSARERFNTITLLILSGLLFIFFFLAGLFANPVFFIIALGTAITGIAFREKPAHVLRQSIFFIIGTCFELLFAFFTSQNFYILLNSVALVFLIAILIRSMQGKIRTSVQIQ